MSTDFDLEDTLLVITLGPITEAVYQAVKDLDMEQFFTVLGFILDRWQERHGKTLKETNDMLSALIVIREEVREKLGPYRED